MIDMEKFSDQDVTNVDLAIKYKKDKKQGIEYILFNF